MYWTRHAISSAGIAGFTRANPCEIWTKPKLPIPALSVAPPLSEVFTMADRATDWRARYRHLEFRGVAVTYRNPDDGTTSFVFYPSGEVVRTRSATSR
jgi:hypothetical protein